MQVFVPVDDKPHTNVADNDIHMTMSIPAHDMIWLGKKGLL